MRYLLLLFFVATGQAAEPETALNPVQEALNACSAMQERFADTECTASSPQKGEYRVTIKAGTPDAMRVVFMRSLDVADALCSAGNKVELSQQLESTAGPRVVRWRILPPDCGIQRTPD